MFKKSEEQEWTRFRGALSKDREDPAAVPAAAEPSDQSAATPQPAPAAPTGQPPTSGPSLRPPGPDVNVGMPNARPRPPMLDTGEVESLIGEHSSFEGTLRTQGPVRLMGTIQGEIESKSTIIVEEKARVTARLTAQQVSVAGQVDGQIYCEGRVEIRPTGRVTGEINAGALIVEEGAYFDGSSKMAQPSGAAAGAAAKS